MPFPDPTGWVPDQLLNQVPSGVPQNILDTFGAPASRVNGGTPPQYILDAIGPSFTWDPNKYQWDGRYITDTSGGRWDYGDVGDPSLGSYVVLPGGATRTAESGGTEIPNTILPGGGPAYYFEPGQGPTFFGNPAGEGQFFFSNDPAAIDEYQHDARTRRNQGIAQIAALVGGAAAFGASGAGSGAGSGTAAGTSTGAATTYPYAAGGSVTATPLAGAGGSIIPAAGSAGGMAGAAGGTGAVGNALGGAASNIPDWVGNYLLPGVNTLLGANAANQASDAMAGAADRAILEGQRQFDVTRNDLMPWLNAGRDALGRLNDPNAFQTSPGYEWLRSEGQRDIGNSFAARGGAASGNALRALAEFNTGLAQQDYGNWWNRQAGLAGVGQTTATTLGGFGADRAANAGNAYMNQGDARASGVLGRTNALQNGLYYGYRNYLNRRP